MFFFFLDTVVTDEKFQNLDALKNEDFPFHSQSYSRKTPSSVAVESKKIEMRVFVLITKLLLQHRNNYTHWR